jgi:hypothetical protein
MTDYYYKVEAYPTQLYNGYALGTLFLGLLS